MVPIDRLLEGAESHRQATGRPLVTLSYAQSLDGSIARRVGPRLLLSSAKSMTLTHCLRAAHDAILVGIGTVLRDDPSLSVRLVNAPSPQPVVLDSHLRFPSQAGLLRGERKPWLATSLPVERGRRAHLQALGVRLLPLPGDPYGRVSLHSLLDCLAQEGITRLMVEGGATVIHSFLAAGLVDRLVLTIAPFYVGGLHSVEIPLENGGRNGSPQRHPDDLHPDHFPRLKEMASERLGDDLIVWGTIT